MKYYILIFFIHSISALQFIVKEMHRDNREYKKNKKKIIINIEGTICETKDSDYINSIANYDNIHKFNSLYEKGHEIHYLSSRKNTKLKNWDSLTLRQFHFWGVKYTSISKSEIEYDYWVGNKCFNSINFD